MKCISRICIIYSYLWIAGMAHGQTHLSGEIGGREFFPENEPFIVDTTLTVAEDKEIVIHEGAIFLFKEFTGIEVNGSIVVEGTKEKPVIFTSVNDADYNDNAPAFPKTFDWNGIQVNNRNDEAVFKHFRLRYSTFGIKSKNLETSIVLALFAQNGQFHFTINDNIIEVPENELFSYNVPEPPAVDTVVDTTEQVGQTDITVAKKRDGKKIKKIIGGVIAGVGLVGCGVGGYYAYDAGEQYDKYYNMPLTDHEQRERYHNDYSRSWNVAAVSIPLGATFIVGGVVVFFFDTIKEKIVKRKESKESKTIIKVTPREDGGVLEIQHSF